MNTARSWPTTPARVAARRSAALSVVVLACHVTLPVAAGDTTSWASGSTVAQPTVHIGNTERLLRFTFTGPYRFGTLGTLKSRSSALHLPLSRLTTGSITPAPVKPNDPPTGSLGGPIPTHPAVSIPDQAVHNFAEPSNPRWLKTRARAFENSEPAAGRLAHVSRAEISPHSLARISDPLPTLTVTSSDPAAASRLARVSRAEISSHSPARISDPLPTHAATSSDPTAPTAKKLSKRERKKQRLTKLIQYPLRSTRRNASARVKQRITKHTRNRHRRTRRRASARVNPPNWWDKAWHHD